MICTNVNQKHEIWKYIHEWFTWKVMKDNFVPTYTCSKMKIRQDKKEAKAAWDYECSGSIIHECKNTKELMHCHCGTILSLQHQQQIKDHGFTANAFKKST